MCRSHWSSWSHILKKLRAAGFFLRTKVAPGEHPTTPQPSSYMAPTDRTRKEDEKHLSFCATYPWVQTRWPCLTEVRTAFVHACSCSHHGPMRGAHSAKMGKEGQSTSDPRVRWCLSFFAHGTMDAYELDKTVNEQQVVEKERKKKPQTW